MKLSTASAGLGIALLLTIGARAQEEPVANPAQQPDPPSDAVPTEEQIQIWVGQLSSRDYRERVSATEKLSTGGAAAAIAVGKAASNGSLESGIRAVAILDAIYQSEDGSAIDSAEQGLLMLKDGKHPGVARRAAQTLQRHYPIRQERAVIELRRLGCQIQFDRFFGRNRAPGLPEHGAVLAVAIGPDWTGGEKGLDHVARLDSLRTAYLLSGHGLSEKAVESLQKRLPRITIQKRGAAFLGVGTENDPLGCLIGQVKVNSAAARGDLRDFDVVIAFGGKPVLGANDLIQAIAQYGPGEKVKVVVLRDYDRGFQMKRALVEMIHDEDEFHPLAALALMSNMRVELEIELGKWDLNN